jgi:acetylornithine deacetylase
MATTIDPEELRRFLASARVDAAALLCELIAIPSTRGNEGPASRLLAEKFAALADESVLVPIPESIKDDPDYSFPLKGITYADRPNVRALFRGAGGGKKLILNTHTDVVPPSQSQETPFDPRVENAVVFGRGACDAKGQAAVIYLACRAIRELGLTRAGDVEVHFVIEEEIGGNGTLAMIRRMPSADAVVVVEPTDLAVCPSVRGAVWFELTVFGRAGHPGAPDSTVNAIEKAVDAIAILERCHDRLLASLRGINPIFDRFGDPMPFTVNEMHAGDYPSIAPTRAVMRGVFGFLPPRTRNEIRQEMADALRREGDDWLRENFDLRFSMLHNEGSVIEPSHPLVKALEAASRAAGKDPVVTALTASCDAWYYANQLKIPTVVFGAGSLAQAHSDDEQISLADVERGAEILVHLICDWCNRTQNPRE